MGFALKLSGWGSWSQGVPTSGPDIAGFKRITVCALLQSINVPPYLSLASTSQLKIQLLEKALRVPLPVTDSSCFLTEDQQQRQKHTAAVESKLSGSL